MYYSRCRHARENRLTCMLYMLCLCFPRQVRLGVDIAYNSDGVDPELAAAVAAAAARLEKDCNCEVVPVVMPGPPAARATSAALHPLLISAVPSQLTVVCRRPAGAELDRYLDAWAELCAPEAVAVHRAAGAWPGRREQPLTRLSFC